MNVKLVHKCISNYAHSQKWAVAGY